MSTEIILPKLGFSMQTGTVAQWLAADGAQIVEGAPLYELEAEKATQEIESPASGTLRILVEPGDDVPVGTVIGSID